MTDEGYVKYASHFERGVLPTSVELGDIITWRNELFDKGFIGAYDDGIGYGNIGRRFDGSDRFVISGTRTGVVSRASNQHFSLVSKIDIDKNELWCSGPVEASSEAMTHYAIYKEHDAARAVIHAHHDELWSLLLDEVPTADEAVPYGTPEMAYEVSRLFKESSLADEKIFVTKGHRGGIFTFGKHFREAAQVLYEASMLIN